MDRPASPGDGAGHGPLALRIGIAVLALAAAGCGGFDPAAPAAAAIGPPAADPSRDLFIRSCASCHGEDRLGLLAPPLVDETIGRRSDEDLARIVRDGIPGTRMPSFGMALADDEIARLVEFVRRPVEIAWPAEAIRTSRREFEPEGDRTFPGDVTAVVERGTGNVLFLVDGELVRQVFFPNVHGGLKYEGDHVFVPARTGFVTKIDLATLSPVRSVRTGVYLRNIEVCGDFVYAACSLPPSLVVLGLDLELRDVVPLSHVPSAVARFDDERVLLAYEDRAALTVLEGGRITGEIEVPAPFRQLSVVEDLVIGSNGRDVHVTDLARSATLTGDGIPHLAAGVVWPRGDALVWATPRVEGDGVAVYSLRRDAQGPRIERLAELPIRALPVRGHTNVFVRAYPDHPYFVTTSGEEVLFLSKEDFSVVGRVTPAPGRMPLHTEFSADGSILFVSVYEERGGIHLYSTRDFTSLAAIPAVKPAGQYNRFMKSWRAYRRSR